MKPLSKTVKDNIIFQLKSGLSTRKIARKFDVSQAVVHKIRKRYCNDVPTSFGGRPKLLSCQDKRRLTKYITSEVATTASMAAKLLESDVGKKISKWTARRALKEANCILIERKKKPALSKKNIKARLSFAKKYISRDIEQWKNVIFSDECKINRILSDGRSWCWKRQGESLKSRHVKQTVKFGGGSVMVWGCITAHGVGPLYRIESTVNQYTYKHILEKNLLDAVDNMPVPECNVVFQHDNATAHSERSVKNWLDVQPFQTIAWPPQSPDLNPIENVWAYLKMKLANDYNTPPAIINDLWERVQEQWYSITPRYCENIFLSMPKRIQHTIKTKGLWTKY